MDQALTATRAQDLNPDTARRWLDEWNRQQEGYVRFRDCRFEIIADALNASGLVAPVILDLGCGPGSLGDRLAARLPGAEIVGLDYDPVLLALARVLHADDPDRSWIELDMRRHDWVDYLEGRQFDAVVSTTALHWLGAPNLMRVYQDLTKVLAPGGVFVNGDICSYDQTQPTLRRMAAASIKANRAAAQTEGAHDWVGWWNEHRGRAGPDRRRRGAAPAILQPAAEAGNDHGVPSGRFAAGRFPRGRLHLAVPERLSGAGAALVSASDSVASLPSGSRKFPTGNKNTLASPRKESISTAR